MKSKQLGFGLFELVVVFFLLLFFSMVGYSAWSGITKDELNNIKETKDEVQKTNDSVIDAGSIPTVDELQFEDTTK